MEKSAGNDLLNCMTQFLKDFIYSFEGGRERERQRECVRTQAGAEGNEGSRLLPPEWEAHRLETRSQDPEIMT